MKTTPMCHRMAAQHHCDSMMDDQQEDADAIPVPAVSSRPADCPMDCCMQATTVTNAVAIPHNAVPLLLTIEKQVSFTPVPFTATGFSSHTDRGPPLS
jgi:hypothetical protein